MFDIQKYMTLTDCPYCHDTPATEMAKNPLPTSIYCWKSGNYLSRYGANVSGMPTIKAVTNILIKEGYEILKAGYLRCNILHTLGLPFANLRLGRMTGSAVWPMVSRLGKADRVSIFARRLPQASHLSRNC